ncbi:hypothetical protein ACWDRR_01825 [Kitasatospora sp. NPDC003701]
MSNFAGTEPGSDLHRSLVRSAAVAAAVGVGGDDDGFGWQVAARS